MPSPEKINENDKKDQPQAGPSCLYLLMASRRKRPDREGEHRAQFEKNRRKILLTQDVCGICGKPVDKNLRWPNPLSPTVDHIIPLDKGGHPSSLENLQLAHFVCNRQKSDKVIDPTAGKNTKAEIISNRILPQSIDWSEYRG